MSEYTPVLIHPEIAICVKDILSVYTEDGMTVVDFYDQTDGSVQTATSTMPFQTVFNHWKEASIF